MEMCINWNYHRMSAAIRAWSWSAASSSFLIQCSDMLQTEISILVPPSALLVDHQLTTDKPPASRYFFVCCCSEFTSDLIKVNWVDEMENWPLYNYLPCLCPFHSSDKLITIIISWLYDWLRSGKWKSVTPAFQDPWPWQRHNYYISSLKVDGGQFAAFLWLSIFQRSSTLCDDLREQFVRCTLWSRCNGRTNAIL